MAEFAPGAPPWCGSGVFHPALSAHALPNQQLPCMHTQRTSLEGSSITETALQGFHAATSLLQHIRNTCCSAYHLSAKFYTQEGMTKGSLRKQGSSTQNIFSVSTCIRTLNRCSGAESPRLRPPCAALMEQQHKLLLSARRTGHV